MDAIIVTVVPPPGWLLISSPPRADQLRAPPQIPQGRCRRALVSRRTRPRRRSPISCNWRGVTVTRMSTWLARACLPTLCRISLNMGKMLRRRWRDGVAELDSPDRLEFERNSRKHRARRFLHAQNQVVHVIAGRIKEPDDVTESANGLEGDAANFRHFFGRRGGVFGNHFAEQRNAAPGCRPTSSCRSLAMRRRILASFRSEARRIS